MTDYVINEKMTPDAAAKALRKAIANAPVTIHVHMTIGMPSREVDGKKYEYPYYTSVEISRKIAFKLLKDMQRFHDGKAARGEDLPMVEYRESVSDYEPYKGNRSRLIFLG